MKYEVTNDFSYDFENVKRIVLGKGKLYYVYRDDIPYVSVEVNMLEGGEHFTDSYILGDYLLIGNYYEGVFAVNLIDFELKEIKVDGYFGYFVPGIECVYILGCENIISIGKDGNIIWISDNLAVDGIVLGRIEGNTMNVSCEMDPPGGWVDKKINLLTGKTVYTDINLYESLRKIEDKLEGEEYFQGGVAYYMTVDKLKFDISDIAALKKYFVGLHVINNDEAISLIPVEDKLNDITNLCNEWHFSQFITDEMLDIVSHCEGYYQMFDDYYYVAKGNISDIFRLIQNGDELVMLELYICD